MSPAALKLVPVGVLALLLITSGSVWKVQDWRYGKIIAEQAGAHQADLAVFSNTAAAQVRTDQDKRLALEQRLAASDKTHHEALTNAQKDQAHLRDRLATSDLRLSVLLDAADTADGCRVPTGTGAGGVVHGRARGELDPAHAQRIFNITNDGDQGLIALRACQAYIRQIAK